MDKLPKKFINQGGTASAYANEKGQWIFSGTADSWEAAKLLNDLQGYVLEFHPSIDPYSGGNHKPSNEKAKSRLKKSPKKRQEEIQERIDAAEKLGRIITQDYLAEVLYVSVSTIRRDIKKMGFAKILK